MRTFLLFSITAAIATAQIVSVGLKGGVPATSAESDYYQGPTSMLDTGRWTIGPTIEFRLIFGFSVEVDALYRGYREQFSYAGSEGTVVSGASPAGATYPATFFAGHTDNNVWDFPLLGKYRIGTSRFRPFVDAGYTFSYTTSHSYTLSQCLSDVALCNASNMPLYASGYNSYSERSGGPTGGVGVEYKYPRLKFAPEVRFTHLNQPRADLVTVMMGVTF